MGCLVIHVRRVAERQPIFLQWKTGAINSTLNSFNTLSVLMSNTTKGTKEFEVKAPVHNCIRDEASGSKTAQPDFDVYKAHTAVT